MSLSYPSYYKNFKCIASACPDSCCWLWEVDVDDATADYYRSLPGALGNRLRRVLTNDNTMLLEDRRCPMWRADGLCRIQAELGHQALCQTCRDFPRIRHDYGDFTELMLELSCPEAARLIFSVPDETVTENAPGTEPDYDRELMALLLQSREAILDFLKRTQMPLNKALTVLLLYAHTVQGAIDEGGDITLDEEECLALGQQFAGPGDLTPVIQLFESLELLTERWANALKAATAKPIDNRLKPLIIYMVRRYWLQAVSDYDLISRAKLAVTACILISCIGGDPVGTSQLFSKEIENDADNLDALLDAAYTNIALTDANLLGLLR